MQKVISFVELEVPASQQVEFEQFFRDEVVRFKGLQGWQYTLLKGDRGIRKGQYAVIVTIDSKENGLRYYPQEGVESEENKQVVKDNPVFYTKWGVLVMPNIREITDYDILVEPEQKDK